MEEDKKQLVNRMEDTSNTEREQYDAEYPDYMTPYLKQAEEPFSYEEALSLFKRFGFTNGEVLELIYDLLEEEKYIAFHHGGQPYYTWKEINKIQDQADDYLSELRNESLKESKSLNESSTDSYLNALLIDKFDELHGSDYNWNRHNCDYTAFYNELREVAGADESDFGREIGPYEMFKRLPLEKKLDFMNRFDRTTKRD